MGLLSGLLGHKEQHPPLDPQSMAARRLEQSRTSVESFAGKVKDRMELVPAADAVYVFIGKPPGAFGIAWIENGEEHNLKTLVQKQGLSQATVANISEALRSAYESHMNEARYQATVAGKTVTVIPSEELGSQIKRVISNVA